MVLKSMHVGSPHITSRRGNQYQALSSEVIKRRFLFKTYTYSPTLTSLRLTCISLLITLCNFFGMDQKEHWKSAKLMETLETLAVAGKKWGNW